MDTEEKTVPAPDKAGDREGVDPKVLDVRPQFGCPSPEPSIRMLIHAYYARHFSQAQADGLTARYLAALSTGNEEPGREGASDLLENLRRSLQRPWTTKIEIPLCRSEAFYLWSLIKADLAAPTPPVSPEPDSRAAFKILRGLEQAVAHASGDDSVARVRTITVEPDSRAGVEFRVGRKVPRNVYRGDTPLFVAASDQEAEAIVDLLNLGLQTFLATLQSAPTASAAAGPVGEGGR